MSRANRNLLDQDLAARGSRRLTLGQAPRERTPPGFGLALLALLLLGLAVRGWFYQQPAPGEDIAYYAAAIGHPEAGSGAARPLFLASARVWVALLGQGLSSLYAAVHFHAGLLGLGMVTFGLVWAGRRGALLMGLLWITSFVALVTDTRLLPYSPGVGLALLALAALVWAASPLGERAGAPAPPRWPDLWVMIGGGLLWGAIGVWELNLVFLPLALAVVLSGYAPVRQLLLLALTLAAGAGLELAYFAWSSGDPWRRLLLLGGGLFPSPSPWLELPWRMLRTLRATGSVELPLFVLGWLGAGIWLLRMGDTLARLKLLGLLLSCGAFALSLGGPEPLLPEAGWHAYLLCLPFFYLAGLELCLWLWAGRRGEEGRTWRDRSWWRGVTEVLGPFAMAALLLLAGLNLLMASGYAPLARNGNDALFALRQAKATGQAPAELERVYLPTGQPLLVELFLRQGKWAAPGNLQVATVAKEVFNDPGLLYLDWRQMNEEVWSRTEAGERTHQFQRILDRFPLYLRHRAGEHLTDVFLVGPRPIQRSRWEVTGRLPPGWSQAGRPVTGQRMDLERDQIIYSGQGELTSRPNSRELTKDRFVQALLKVRGHGVLKVSLLGWAKADSVPGRHYLGRLAVDQHEREMAVWSYLPEEYAYFRLLLEGEQGRVRLGEVRLFQLGRHAKDRLSD